jgi:hypothetical protein
MGRRRRDAVLLRATGQSDKGERRIGGSERPRHANGWMRDDRRKKQKQTTGV